MSGRTTFEFDFSSKTLNGTSVKDTRSIQPRLYLFNNPHIRSIDFFYESSEKPISRP